MSQLTKRLSYSIPLFLVAALIAVENFAPLPYVFSTGTGAVSGLYFKVFKPESLRYSKAMVEVSKGLVPLAGATPELRRPAAGHFRAAAGYLAEVHRAWVFDKVPKGLNGDDFDQLKADLAAAATALEAGAYLPESPEGKRIAAYHALAKTSLPNGSVL